MMEMVAAVAALALVIALWSTIRKLGDAVTGVVGGVAGAAVIVTDGLDDTAKTYASTISVNNVQVRKDLMAELEEMGEIVTQKQLDDKLAGK